MNLGEQRGLSFVWLFVNQPQRSITDHLFASSVYASYQICLITLLKH